MLAAALFCLTLGGPAHATPPDNTAPAARVGAELGALASAGGDLAAPSAHAQPAPTVAAPGPQPTPTASPSPAPTPVPDKGKLVVIDPGHGGTDPGAVHTTPAGAADVAEEEVNLWIALKLAEMLRADGYHVQLTRTDDRAVGPDGNELADVQARVDMANQAGADILVSVHHNGSNNRSLSGATVYYCNDRSFSADNRRLAGLVQEALVRNMRQAGYDVVDRGAQDDAVLGHLALLASYNVSRPSQMPAVLGEALFMSNDADAAILKRADMREAIARGYFEGVKAYFEGS